MAGLAEGASWPADLADPGERGLRGLVELDDDELVGVLKAWHRLESWCAAGGVAAVAELARRRPADGPRPDRGRGHDNGQVVLVHGLDVTPAGRCSAGARSAGPAPSSPGSHHGGGWPVPGRTEEPWDEAAGHHVAVRRNRGAAGSMVGVKVCHRVIPLVPVHVDHDPEKRADTRHAPTTAASAIGFRGGAEPCQRSAALPLRQVRSHPSAHGKGLGRRSDSGLFSEFKDLCATEAMLLNANDNHTPLAGNSRTLERQERTARKPGTGTDTACAPSAMPARTGEASVTIARV